MDSVSLKDAGPIVADMAAVIVEHAAYLSEIDGAIGDGDHGINMSKGFRRAGERLGPHPPDLAQGFATLGETLLDEIGGSTGPLYGSFFLDMAASLKGRDAIDRDSFGAMLHAGVAAVIDLGGAKTGDKTLVDVLAPAVATYDEAAAKGEPFHTCLEALDRASEAGLEATRDMVARIGRASRLGERSRGHLDAGAASCRMLLGALSRGLRRHL
ncbi:dihydroxyacetone kinase subunit DhaL [Methylocapsa sp. S129]|uniref:dihydroxyacetone kinase subunit DhaL n=1 Tax=Methylocapsa sp. S129 TaxID=1641869 RepID=UPI00131B4BBD|nr:dihydroxyacetone kinase subunit DhaL [Methylocapsa sp. S129]